MIDQIKDCEYITSIGMMLSLDELNMIKYDQNGAHYDFNKISNGKDGCCIYIKFQYLSHFINNILPQINYKFILITGDGDETLPNDFCDLHTFYYIINNDKIIHWYSTNCIESLHPKLSLIPCGVNFHSLSFGAFGHWGNDAKSPIEQEKEIISIRKNSAPISDRIRKCYSNFHFAVYNEFGNARKEAIEKIDKNLVFFEQNLINRTETWTNNSKYAFTLSPLGHGLDCHRTWESLMLGCIVIVKSSPLDNLYKDLPVLIINDWADLTENLLNETIDKFKDCDFDYDRITSKYWIYKIKNKKT